MSKVYVLEGVGHFRNEIKLRIENPAEEIWKDKERKLLKNMERKPSENVEESMNTLGQQESWCDVLAFFWMKEMGTEHF